MTPARYLCEMQCRRCRESECVFRPSSRHLRYPSCRSRGVCECGRSKQVKSATCGVCRSVSTEANGNWKGGRTRHKAGYVMVRAPGHPRATSGPYVFEHILVAEDLLGRHLRDGETVHHRNGAGDDNRTENLELWTSPQPSGIRVSDAIEWAPRFLNGTRALVHLQRPSRSRVRAPGGGGIRTDSGPTTCRGQVPPMPSAQGKHGICLSPTMTATDRDSVSFRCSCVFFVSRRGSSEMWRI